MPQYKGNPTLWNHRSEARRAQEAHVAAAAELEAQQLAENLADAGVILPEPRAKRTRPEPVETLPAETTPAPTQEQE
jgi:hypothetical protein